MRVDERQFARLHRLLAEVGRSLDVSDLPEMYVAADPALSAATVGMDRPIIVLSSGLVHHLDDDELRFVIGHELGHAVSGHAVYRTLLMRLLGLGGLLYAVPGGAIGIRMVTVGLLEWSRKAELSADRAGLLATPGPDRGPPHAHEDRQRRHASTSSTSRRSSSRGRSTTRAATSASP